MTRDPRFKSRPADLRRDVPPSTVSTQRPDPEAWSLALEHADGDARRLEVIDHRTIRVLNRPA